MKDFEFLDIKFYDYVYDDLNFEVSEKYIEHYLDFGCDEKRQPNLLTIDNMIEHPYWSKITYREWLNDPVFNIDLGICWSYFIDALGIRELSDDEYYTLYIELFSLYTKLGIIEKKDFYNLIDILKLHAYYSNDVLESMHQIRKYIQGGSFDLNKCNFFDAGYYLEKNSDLRDCDDLFSHFINHGLLEGRIYNLGIDSYEYRELSTKEKIEYFFEEEYSDDKSHRLESHINLSILGSVYSKTSDIAALAISFSLNLKEFILLKDVLNLSYVTLCDCDYNLSRILEDKNFTKYPLLPQYAEFDDYSVLDFIKNFDEKEAYSTPLYNDELYLKFNKDIHGYPFSGYQHFLRHGQYENRRSIHLIDPSWAQIYNNYHEQSSLTAIFENLKSGIITKISPGVAPLRDIKELSKLLSSAYTQDWFCSSILKEQIKKASLIEPSIKLVANDIIYTSMPYNMDVFTYSKGIASNVGVKDVLLFRDSINFGGADVILKYVYHAYKTKGYTVGIISIGEIDYKVCRAHSLDINDVIDFSYIESEHIIQELVYDVIVGSKAKISFNINCKALWDVTIKYGSSLTNNTLLLSYLFCNDKDEYGNVSGYMQKYFLKALPYVNRYFFDSVYFANEAVNKVCGYTEYSNKIVYLPTPLDTELPTNKKLAEVDIEGFITPNIGWAGRFDPQKRPDILVSVANELPNLSFRVWGKSILSNTAPPLASNIINYGLYSSVEEISEKNVHLYLYTSEWDGAPTILLRIIELGIPVIASDTGGVREIIPAEYLVKDINDISNYVDKISWFLRDYKKNKMNFFNSAKILNNKRSASDFNIKLLGNSEDMKVV